jgi:hypothetical protein
MKFLGFSSAETVTSQRYQENMLDDHTFTPGFLTLGQKYSIAIGNTVVLPCKINETGKISIFRANKFHFEIHGLFETIK